MQISEKALTVIRKDQLIQCKILIMIINIFANYLQRKNVHKQTTIKCFCIFKTKNTCVKDLYLYLGTPLGEGSTSCLVSLSNMFDGSFSFMEASIADAGGLHL